MKRITIDGVSGVSLWPEDGSPLIAFRPDGSDEWAYYLKPKAEPTNEDDA